MCCRKSVSLLLVIGALMGLAACQPGATPEPAPVPTATPTAIPPTATPLIRQEPAATPAPDQTALPPAYGPADFPPDVNPLTGLPVSDPAVLDRRPLLIKVSNESESVRPQSGLSFADHVWMYQMEGWAQTRFTAVYYSQAPEHVGSVRSVRLIDSDHLIPMYGGLLAYSGCSIGMCTIVGNAPWFNRTFNDDGRGYLVRIPDVPRPGTAYYHTLHALPDLIWQEADRRGVNQRPNLDGLLFDYAVPPGCTQTTEAAIDYPGSGPRQTWRYDEASGRWLSWTEMQNVSNPQETPDIDYLTGQQLAFDNVIILSAEFYLANFIEDEPNQLLSIGPILVGQGDAVLLRDGMRYNITWRRDDVEKMIQFYGPDGQLIPLKPGTTWFNVVSFRADQYPPTVTFTSFGS